MRPYPICTRRSAAALAIDAPCAAWPAPGEVHPETLNDMPLLPFRPWKRGKQGPEVVREHNDPKPGFVLS